MGRGLHTGMKRRTQAMLDELVAKKPNDCQGRLGGSSYHFVLDPSFAMEHMRTVRQDVTK